ncbi:unnamed protein product, partial [Rotaria sp. Silwood1]
ITGASDRTIKTLAKIDLFYKSYSISQSEGYLFMFELESKIVVIVTDNGRDMRAATQRSKMFGLRLYCLCHDPKTIHEELVAALGPNAPSYTTVTGWAKRFREGREEINDDPRFGRPVSKLTDENIELARQVIITSRWVPHELTDEQKQQGVQFCRENLAKFQTGSWRLCDIITGDET